MFKFLEKFRYLEIQDLPQTILIEEFTVNVHFLVKKKTRKITVVPYLPTTLEIVNSVQQIENAAVLIFHN